MARRDTVMRKPKDTRGTLRRMLRFLGPFRWVILGVACLSLVSNVLSLWGPNLAGSAIREAAAGKGLVNFERVAYYATLMLVCYLASSLLGFVISLIMTVVSKRVGRQMRQSVFDKLMKLPVGYFDRHQAGDIISRVSYDIDVISTCIATDVVQILTSVVTVVGSVVMMVSISLPLSAVVLVTVPVAISYTAWMRKRTQPRYAKRSRSYGDMNGFVEEMLSGQKTILAYAYEDKVDERFDKINQTAADAYADAEHYGVTIGPTMSGINNLSLSLIGLLGAVLFMNGAIDLGRISSFVLYSRKFAGPINAIAEIVNELFSALAAAERVFTLLDEQEEAADAENAVELSDVQGRVEADHVVFGYDPGRTIIHDLSLTAEAGRLTAIVGPTGVGKTTVINLLMRFYDPDSGCIRIDGQDIREATRRSVRSAYAMVLQDTWVFNGTIFDNIAYGKENATMEEVVAAAKAAHIHPFIMRLPQGYQTVISEDGGNISKGQKQLLTIARAMLYNAPMLILDEATSNVDTATEREIQRAMRELMKGRTCFVIAHRLSTIENADLILVMNGGDVVEQGTHAELMEKKGFYYGLYSAQFE
ncbi:MAG: ABC transporter ATP-binding protein [Clostridia bacterium]|nr:ABC transporter ATP-binding protein [Clostridia bacterium]